jgi:predicted DNA-binding protein YlxM (UPF0122 family)
MFGNFGIHKAATQAMFDQLPRKDQNEVMQSMYDNGYSGKDIAKFFAVKAGTIYGRIDAHRGRGPGVELA